MASKLLIGLLLVVGFLIPRANAEAPIAPAPPQLTVREYVHQEAREYGVSFALANRIVSCESQWDPKAVGDHGTSFGLWQIHVAAHPGITKEEAMNPYWSTDWSIKELAAGEGSQWSCY